MPPKKNTPKKSAPLVAPASDAPPPDNPMDVDMDAVPVRESGAKLISELIAESDMNLPKELIDGEVYAFSIFSDDSDWRGIAPHFVALSSLSRRASDYDNWDTRFRVYRYLISCFRGLQDAVQEHASSYVNAADGERHPNLELANAVSMMVILAQRLTVQIQLYVSKSTASSNAGKKGRGRQANLDEDIVDWKGNQRERMIKHLVKLLEMKVDAPNGTTKLALPYVFAPDVIEKDLIGRFMDTVIQLLEDPENAVRANQQWLAVLFRIWKALSTDYSMATNIANSLFTKTLDLTYLETANSFPFIEPLVTLMTETERPEGRQHRGLRTVLEMVVRRACNLYSGDRADRPPPKSFCMIIQALAVYCPDIILQEIYHVFKLLDNQHVNVRMCTLQALADIFSSSYLSKDLCEKFPSRRKKRLDIFFKICRHVGDEGTTVRGKAVSLLRSLMENRRIPEEYESMGVISVVGGRLADKSVLVRKAAMQFLTVFLENNAQGHDFTRSVHVDLMKTKRIDMNRLSTIESRTIVEATEHWNARKFYIQRDVELEFGAILRDEVLVVEQDPSVTGPMFADLDARKVGAQLARFYAGVPDFKYHKDKRPTMNLSLDQMLKLGTKEIMNKGLNDYEDFRVQLLMSNDDARIEDEQAAEDRKKQAICLKGQVQQLINKMSIEIELAACLQLALRCVRMGENAEIKEGIKFLSRCKLFGISEADNAIRKMCTLVWRTQTDVVSELVEAAEEMFISKLDATEKAAERHKSTVENLMSVMNGVEEEDRSSVEEVIFLLAADEKDKNKRKRTIDVNVITRLWNIALDNSFGCNGRKIDALRILYAISRTERGLPEARNRLRSLQKKLNDEPMIAVEALRIISILGTTTQQDDTPEAHNRPVFRIHQDDSLFKSIEALFFREVVKPDDTDKPRDWFGIIRLTIHTLLNVSMDVNVMLPKLAAHFLYRAKKISEFFLFYSKQAENATSATLKDAATVRKNYWSLTWCRVMEKLMAFCGEVAVQLHAYIQVTVPRLHARYLRKMTEAARNDSKVREEPVRLISDLEKSIAQKKTIFSISEEHNEATALNDLYHTVAIMCDKRLFVPAKLLGRLLPIVAYGMRANTMPNRIQYAAQNAFGKFMPLSAEISAFAAPSFFSIMSNSPSDVLRSNMISSCCDFAFSQPTLFELYAPTLFRMSQDISPFARESTILVLSHLMTNDMIQTRGVLSEPARCICDPSRPVREAAQSFFRELNVRNDTLTQLLPEFLFRLAATSERLPLKAYKTVFEFLITLLKEKTKASADVMIDRVCMKFSNLDMNDTEGPKYLLIALNKFIQNDGAIHRFQENWRHWSKFLCHPNIAKEYRQMIQHMQNTSKSEDFKGRCEDLINNIDKIQAGGLRKEDVAGPTIVKKGKGRKPTAVAAASTSGPSTSTPKRKRAKSPIYEESDESDGGQVAEMDQK